jgi:iron complex outermembrane receptor protein
MQVWGKFVMNSYPQVFNAIKKTVGLLGIFGVAVLLFAPAQTFAQEDTRSASASVLLDEVIVSARRREERLLDQPMSIAVLTAEAMQVQGIYNIDDASRFVPNVTLQTHGRANNTRIVIRGIGGGFPDPTFAFGSGMYIDGHYIPQSLGGYMSTMDIERIELLRGPQGTLFGKNVTGGAVNIVSTKPQDEFDSSIRLRAAEDGELAIRGMVNVPFSDKFFGRFTLASEEFDGYYHNQYLNIDSGGTEIKAGRAAFRFMPNDQWTFDAVAATSEKSDDNMGGQCLGPGPRNDAPGWGGGAGNLERRLYTGAEQDFHDLCAADVAAGDFVNSSDKRTFSDVNEDSLHLGAEWNTGSLSISAKAAFREMDYQYLADRDYTSWPVDHIGTKGVGTTTDTTGFEFLIEGGADGNIRWTVGVNYFDEESHTGASNCYPQFVNSGAITDPGINTECTPQDGLLFELVPNNPNGVDIHPGQDPDLWPNAPRINGGGPGPFFANQDVWNESIGLFGHVTWDISDSWTLDVGARWTEDDRRFRNIELPATGCDISIDPTGLCDVTINLNQANVIDEGFFNTAADTFSEVTPMVSLTRNLASGNGMFYALYSEGFLTGGFNSEINSNLPDTEQFLTYDPEHVTNYEIGFKGTFMGGNVQLMADVFYMDYRDQQRSLDIANPLFLYGADDPISLVQNVAKSAIVGMEVELRAAFWEGGYVSVDLGYLKNDYDEYEYQDPSNPGDTVDLSNVLIHDYTPEWTLNVAVEHEFVLGGGSKLTPRLSMYYQSDYEFAATTGDWPDSAPPSSCNTGSYTKLDGRLTFRPANGDWQAAIIGGNLTDERIIEFCDTARSVWRWRLERPRWFGLEFSAHFGRS